MGDIHVQKLGKRPSRASKNVTVSLNGLPGPTVLQTVVSEQELGLHTSSKKPLAKAENVLRRKMRNVMKPIVSHWPDYLPEFQ